MQHQHRKEFVVLLSSSNEQSKKETKKTILFLLVSKRIKHPGVKLTKKNKTHTLNIIRHCSEKCKKRYKWKDILCSWIGRLLRWQCTPKQYTDSMQPPREF